MLEIPTTYVKVSKRNAGYEQDKESINILYDDTFYEVEKINMGQSYTYLRLKNLRPLFNSVNFDFFDKDYNKIDIYRMKEYNPYMQDFLNEIELPESVNGD